jgi:hypothetical protein
LDKKESAVLSLSPNRLMGALIISGPETKNLRKVVVYGVSDTDRGVFYHNKMFELNRVKFDICEWGPMNKRFVLGDKSEALFCEVSKSKNKKKHKLIYTPIKSVEMDKYDKIMFSPCGRFVCFVTEAGELLEKKKDTNLIMKFYTCYGDFIKKEIDRDMRVFSWRNFPLPNINVSKKQSAKKKLEKKVEENLADLEAQDLKIVDEMKFQKIEREKKELMEFEAFIKERHQFWDSRKSQRIETLGFDEDRMQNQEMVQVSIEDKRELIVSKDVTQKTNK